MLYATTRMPVQDTPMWKVWHFGLQLDLFVGGTLSAEEALATAQKQGDKILAEAASK